MWLLCTGGQKIANIATFGKLGGKSEKSDSGGKEAYKVPKVGLLFDNVFVLTPCIAKLALQPKDCSAAQKLICIHSGQSGDKNMLSTIDHVQADCYWFLLKTASKSFLFCKICISVCMKRIRSDCTFVLVKTLLVKTQGHLPIEGSIGSCMSL